MASQNFDIEKIAHLARLDLSSEEKDRMRPQFEQILGHIDQLNALNTDQVEPTSHVLPITNVLREDKTRPRPEGKDYLSLAPKSDKGHYEVPQII